MSKNKNKQKNKAAVNKPREEFLLHPDTKKSIWAVVFLMVALVLLLASFSKAGPLGDFVFGVLERVFGLGYYILPLIFVIMAGVFFASERRRIYKITFIGATIFVLASLGLIDIVFPGDGGWIGKFVGLLEIPFGYIVSLIISVAFIIISLLITLNLPIKIKWLIKKEEEQKGTVLDKIGGAVEKFANAEVEMKNQKSEEQSERLAKDKSAGEIKEMVAKPIEMIKGKLMGQKKIDFKNYVAPPLSLLKSSVEKPTSGDLRANANIIRRTLESFGIPVEMGEINIGPKVTRYTLKPAEGIKLSRITTLNQDLSLALAAHPIRIEAPIPGKSLVGIEVPNKAAAVVRLGSLMAYPEFNNSGPIGFVLGRDVSGEPIFSDIAKMPHLLIAGSTGSGKSITIHSLIISLLYKNSPETLRMILIDPKRVELSV